ncbi:hypothetical protein XO10_06620 [Marinitoga sp. 1135]|uniref:Outer membrane protein beta-barrel domain-containing protein n=1 Tax=Marinitoga piezophila (strain DSM 14283 / JCM 11233 / KA3) TaxID=443254 RepID=H2J3D0_MARPK|nr:MULTISPECIES: hypothetical protein [Marinitoga]AEX85746.1 hypothetical protein Marpi_1343 [Marinitoga piezophila KA3]APT76191.1 hypothetical protein LN42_07175 [Marinitoga sp. 1137]NUU95950.1 hypothetical protein [Marinitoga sp. 1135]NUU97861.1 hypothetical protein [Marinitoga sp. 1138]
MKKLLLTLILFVNVMFFGFETLLPSGEVLDEGILKIDTITPGVAAIRYGLFGIMEVGVSTSNGGAYIKVGSNKMGDLPLAGSVSFGFEGVESAHIIGNISYISDSLKLSVGTDYTQKMETEFNETTQEPKTIIDSYFNIFGGLNYLISSDEKTDKFLNIEVTTGFKSNGTEYGIAGYIYGIQSFKKFWLFNKVNVFGGLAVVNPSIPPNILENFRVVFGLNTEINLFGNK